MQLQSLSRLRRHLPLEGEGFTGDARAVAALQLIRPHGGHLPLEGEGFGGVSLLMSKDVSC